MSCKFWTNWMATSSAIIVKKDDVDCRNMGKCLVDQTSKLLDLVPEAVAVQSFIPLLAISNSWVLNLIWFIISSIENTTNRLSGLFDFSMKGKSMPRYKIIYESQETIIGHLPK